MANIDLKSLFLKLKSKLSPKSGDRHYVFIFLALLMLIILIFLVIWGAVFLISNFTEAFTEDSKPAPTEKFDIKGFEELDLIK